MKLLLTSEGFTNKKIIGALRDLVEKPFGEVSLAFIPTAANVDESDKSWLVDDYRECLNLGLKFFDIVDISALDNKIWEPRLRVADILVFGGGNTFHLIYWIRKSGLYELLAELLATKIYVGISAGSMVTSSEILLSQSKRLYYEDLKGNQDDEGLGYVDFQFRPHLNSPNFPNVNEGVLQELAKEIDKPIYALDDNMALKVVDGKVDVVGEGKYLLFNAKN